MSRPSTGVILNRLAGGRRHSVAAAHYTGRGRQIPVIIGGRSDAAIGRAGQYGDGWFGIRVSAGRYRQAIAQMHQAAQIRHSGARDTFPSLPGNNH